MTPRTMLDVRYRAPLRAPQGEWARFIHRMRQERDWSSQAAFEALREVLRLGPKSRASYLRLESGERTIRDWEQDALVDYFGQGPSDEDRVEPTPPVDYDLVTALREQTVAIQSLADAILASRADQKGMNEGLAVLAARVVQVIEGRGGTPE